MAMSFHPSKCTVIRIPSQRKKLLQTNYMYQVHGQTLRIADSSKYLGVTISDDLTWRRHIQQITGKGNRTVGFLTSNFQTLYYPSEKDHLYSNGQASHGVCPHHMGPGQTETYPDAETSPTAICIQQLY